MIRLLRWFFLSISISLALGSIPLSENALKPPPLARLSLHKLRVFPGDVLRVDLKVSSSVEKLDIRFNERQVVFQPDTKRHWWRGLVGIDLETKPEGYSVRGSVRFVGGETVDVERNFQVLPKSFPVQRITVDEKYVTLDPSDQKRAEQESLRLDAIWKAVTSQKLWEGPFLFPVRSQLTSGFGRRRIVNNKPRSPHSGVDLQASSGTPIRAANAGTVVLAADLFFGGNTIVLDHGLGLYTYYAHCSMIAASVGDRVTRGQVIAKVGATGRVTGAHLHWACRLNEARVNPIELTQAWMPQ